MTVRFGFFYFVIDGLGMPSWPKISVARLSFAPSLLCVCSLFFRFSLILFCFCSCLLPASNAFCLSRKEMYLCSLFVGKCSAAWEGRMGYAWKRTLAVFLAFGDCYIRILATQFQVCRILILPFMRGVNRNSGERVCFWGWFSLLTCMQIRCC